MSNPLVSIIIPAYNGEQFLTEAIHSILKQDYVNYEILVVNNGSTDRTAAIAQFFSEIKYIDHPKADTATARNLGVSLSRGDYLAFLDQDDTWPIDRLSSAVNFLEMDQTADAVIGLQHIYLQPGCKKPSWLKSCFLEAPQPAYLPSALMVRRNIFNYFNTAFSFTSDVDWFFKAKDRGISIAILPKVLVNRRIHEENASGNVNTIHKEILTIIKNSLQYRRTQLSHE
jgi:glycosyltransferase involved in cell wall biosynthesis